jgi:tRNA A37 threonylcarbamoyladenosine modification protein TsaB
MILLIDTSSKQAFISLISNVEVIDFKELEDTSSLSKTLYSALDIMLKKQNQSPQDIKRVIFGRGPGSFLGIRTAANVSSALSVSLKIDAYSFISPLAYLPPVEGNFAYIMRPKGGKFSVLFGIKKEFETKILSFEKIAELDEFWALDWAINKKIDYIVTPLEKEEFSSESIPQYMPKADVNFLPILAQVASQQLEETSTPFPLIY